MFETATSTVAATKLTAPSPPAHLVVRARLHEALDRAVAAPDRPVVLVSAPAGAGKSTLVAGWLATRDHDTAAWVQLDDFDRDPARFWASVVAALARVIPDVEDAVGGALSRSGLDAEPVIVRLVNLLAARPGRVVLVLDDYHLLDSAAVDAGVERLVALAPPQLTLVVLTRVDPAIRVSRLRVRGLLTEIRADDLRFSADEAGALLSTDVAELDAGHVAILCERTEGWAAGLVLAGLSLEASGDRVAVVAAFAGDDRLVVDYLTEEFLAGIDERDRERLLRTALVDRFCGPLVDVLCDATDGTPWLRDLATTNQLVIGLDRTGTWFRYHHLLREVLRQDAEHELGAEVIELHRRAGAWHAAHGSPHDAVEHHLMAGDAAVAVDLLWDHATELLNRGQVRTVLNQVERLGPAGEHHPRALLLRGWIDLLIGRFEEAWRCLDRATAVELGHEEAGHAVALGIMRGLATGNVAQALAVADQSGPPIDATHAMTLGGVQVWAGRFDQARPMLRQAAEIAIDEGHLFVSAVTPVFVAIADVEQGREASAARRSQQALEAAEVHALGRTPQLALAHSILARTGQSTEARRSAAHRGVELARDAPELVMLGYALTCAGDALCDLGDDDGPDLLREARRVVQRCPDPGIVSAYLARAEARHALTAIPEQPTGLIEPLTERELAVLRHLPTPLSQRDIAGELYVSLNTVKTHCRAIYRKLGVSDRAHAVQAARDHGLL